MQRCSSTRFERKLDALFWMLVSLLPLVVYIVNVYNGGTIDFFTFVNENFTFAFISQIFEDVFLTAFESVFPLTSLLSYWVSVELIHCLFDVVVFLPRFARKAVGKVVEL